MIINTADPQTRVQPLQVLVSILGYLLTQSVLLNLQQKRICSVQRSKLVVPLLAASLIFHWKEAHQVPGDRGFPGGIAGLLHV